MADDPIHPSERTDRSPWNWLLMVPIVIPLLTFLYDGADPRLFGFPRFYWLQLSFVGLTIVCNALVFRMTKRKPGLPRATVRQTQERRP